MAEERKAQEKSQRDRLLKTIELDQAAMGLDIDMAKTALEEGAVRTNKLTIIAV